MSHSKSANGHHSSASRPAPSLFVKVKYNNTLPDIPFDPKFLVNPLDVSRYIDYKTTSLEQNSKHELLAPMDLGVDIDLILPERYAIPDNPIHDPEDDRLINDDEPMTHSTKKSPRDRPHSQLHNKVVPWLKKTEYISTEYNRYGSSSEKTETKVGYHLRKSIKDEEIFLDRDSQIKAINQTFEAAQKPIEKHPTKANVTAKRVLPLFPDYDMWKYTFAHVKFDSEPADPSKADAMSNAIIRGAFDEELQENFVVYFLPTEITMTDRCLDQTNGIEYTEGKEYEYISSREYTWSAKQDNASEDFLFVLRDDCVYYNRLVMEVTLKKRRNKVQPSQSTTLMVKNRPLAEDEVEQQQKKLAELDKPKPASVSPGTDADMTAASLEQAYEDQATGERGDSQSGPSKSATQTTANAAAADNESNSSSNPNGDEEGQGVSSSSSSSSSSSDSASSSPASSSGGSSSSSDPEESDQDS